MRLRGLPTKATKDDVLAFVGPFEDLSADAVTLHAKGRRTTAEVRLLGPEWMGSRGSEMGESSRPAPAAVQTRRPLPLSPGPLTPPPVLRWHVYTSVQVAWRSRLAVWAAPPLLPPLAADSLLLAAPRCHLQAYVVFSNLEDAQKACTKDKVGWWVQVGGWALPL